jgi:hypothetical protein
LDLIGVEEMKEEKIRNVMKRLRTTSEEEYDEFFP